jgi:hypothetical protein
LVEYQKVSGRPTLPSRRAAALRVATICAFRQSTSVFGRQRLHTTTPGLGVTCGSVPGAGVIVADLGRDYPVHREFTRLVHD